jgi:hypothetical protein
MLDPRLSEYLKKKKYFRDNGIEIHQLEKEFNITDRDSMRIRAYFRGDKKKSPHTKNGIYQDLIDPTEADFPSSKFKKDARLDRITKKQTREEEAINQRQNYGLMNRGYDMYRNDRPFASAYGDDFKKSDFHPKQWFEESNRDEFDSRAELFQNSKDSDDNRKNPHMARISKPLKNFSRSNTYTNPKSRYNGYLPNESSISHDPHSIDAIIGELDSYRQKVNTPYGRLNEMDLEHKVVLPNGNSNEKRETENNYRSVPYMSGAGNRDIDVDTFVRFGATPSRVSKSSGYPNPIEHHFDYISNDIQNPDHVVNERGLPSRMFNKETARPEPNGRKNRRELFH